MERLKTVESRVLSVLKDCPRARFDDMILFPEYSRSADNDDNIVIIIGIS